jgi:hypothetical protein
MKQLLSILFILTAVVCFANNNVVKNESSTELSYFSFNGKVVDSESKESLAGVMISVSDYKVYTDLDGNFELEIPYDLSDDSIKISYISYEEVELSVKTNKIQTIEIKQIQ